ncbi:Piwi-like protein 1 [Habropoda laboriosa]|uniref:Piwi-like protein 1 n=2 Tax=Habropoda laboriosa TaxID=597456 RepID=A0A0L7QN65_9HYME|nr:Piwi-like protein 1 [Habropoda laboriosa]
MLLEKEKEKEKEKSGHETIAQSVSAVASSSKDQTQKHSDLTFTSEIPISSPMGLGRGNLLNLMKTMTPIEMSDSKPLVYPKPMSVVGQGRGSLLSRLKSASLVEKPSSVPASLPDDAGVLGKLSDITAQENKTPQEKTVSYQGTGGKVIQLSANYINLKLDPTKGLFNYEVKYNPDIDSRPLRRKLLNQHLQALGRTRVFDGAILYLPEKLKEAKTIFESTHPMDGSKVNLTLIYKKQQSMSENIAFFNVLLGRVMRALSLIRIGQHSFNPKGVHAVPQHKLEVWPGYVTTINEYDGGLKLCIDARHRVMRTETVREIMMRFGSKPNFKDAVMRELIGLSIFTRYNNKTYRVDDIAWDRNPTYEFDKEGEKISLIHYYKHHWNLEIKDRNQPLLVHCAKRKLPTGQTEENQILLVPELCYTASLSDSIRSDFRVMKDLDEITKMSPNARRDVFRHFIQEIQNNDVPREILADWGLHLETDVLQFKGRVLEPENIFFGNGAKFICPPNKPVQWSSAVCRSTLLRTPSSNHFCVLYCNRDTRCAQEFIGMLKKVSKVIGMTIGEPQAIPLKDDRIETYVHALRNNIQQTVSLMIVIFPTNRTDKYSAVKRVCCVEMPVPSQVIISKTISRSDKLKSITEKIALQINCKIGGALWALAIPMENCMICGIDVYHAGVGQSTKGSVAGFVASLDKLLTTWHSKVSLQGKHQELVDMLQICLISAVKAYYKYNKRYPDRIIVYRDGVGEGQIDTVARYEVKQLLAAFKNIEQNYQPTLTVIVVHKRINTRIFAKCSMGLENPPPGTIVDSYITKPAYYDFFLVSQNVREGTVSPTHYIVVYDNRNMKAEHIQRLTYKLCHLYYNWPGTIKVPAPCQYAHKLASLVGLHLQLEPHQSLVDTLYYL